MNNHLSLQLIGTFKNTMTYDIRNPGPGLGEAQTYGRVKLLNGISTLLLNKLDPMPGNTYLNKQ
jgi:hypothetical protein